MVQSWWKRRSLGFLILLLGMTVFGSVPVLAADGVTLYTTYTNISVPPGEALNYPIDLINKSSVVQNVKISVAQSPSGWEYQLTSGGWKVSEMAVLPGETKTVNLDVKVPLEVEKGDYVFNIAAEGLTALPLHINVSEKGTFKTELTTDQPNMEGHVDATFTFQTNLRNRTANKQLYGLTAKAPEGWDVQFNTAGKQVSSVSVDANNSSSLDINVVPPKTVAEGTYKIPISAGNGTTSAAVDLEVVIKGSYKLELSTPSGLLSTDITAGHKKTIDLKLTNSGTAQFKNIELTSSAPTNWEVTFDQKTVETLEAGQSIIVQATIKADGKALPGDYATNITATAAEASSAVDFRIAVKTSMLWGWLGIAIILAVIGAIYYLFRKYGRR